MSTGKMIGEHHVFSELDRCIYFYDNFANSTFGWLASGTQAVFHFDSYVFSSMKSTLESIKVILKNGAVGDSYSLLRRFYDSAVFSVYTTLYLQEHYSIENRIVKKINDWVLGQGKVPRVTEMCEYIGKSNQAKWIYDLLESDDRYGLIRKRCNDLMHINSLHGVLLNDGGTVVEERMKWIDQFSDDVHDVFVLHLAYLFHLNSNYLMSSDYIDYMECGLTPPDDCQYWVAPFVKEIFYEVLHASRPDLAKEIKSQSCMQL